MLLYFRFIIISLLVRHSLAYATARLIRTGSLDLLSIISTGLLYRVNFCLQSKCHGQQTRILRYLRTKWIKYTYMSIPCYIYRFPLHDGQLTIINPYAAKVIYLNFQPLEAVSRYRDPQPQVVENYSYLFNLKPNIYKSWYLNSHLLPNSNDFIG